MRLRTIALVIAVLALLSAYVVFAPRHASEGSTDAREERKSSSALAEVDGNAQALAARTAIPVLPKIDHRATTFAPMPPVGTRLLGIYDTLQRQALNGDPRAACRLAFELQECAGLPGLRQFVADIRARQADPETPASLRDGEGKAARFFGGLAERAEATCAGFPREETANAWKWELAAALAGYPPSMARFAVGSTTRALNPEDQRQDGNNAYRDHAPELLQRAIDAGEPLAFELAMHAHRRGGLHGVALVPRDEVRAAAYAIALRRVAAPAYADNFDLGSVKRRLGLERYTQALQIAEGLSAKLARVPAGSVDFTNGFTGRDDGSHCDRPPD